MCTLYVHVCDHTVCKVMCVSILCTPLCIHVCILCVCKFYVRFLCVHVACAHGHVHSVMHAMCVQIVCAWCVCTHCVCKCVCMLGVGAHSGGPSEVQGGLWWWGGEGLPGPVCVLPAESRGSAQAGPGRELPLGTWRQVDQLGLELALDAGTTQTPRHGISSCRDKGDRSWGASLAL